MKKIASHITAVITVIAITLFSTSIAYEQGRTRERKARVVCNYPGDFAGPRKPGRALNFASPFEAEAAADRIVRATGLTRNFVIEESESDDIPNAASDIDGNGKRYIYYNRDFIRRIVEKAGTIWAAVFVMAHEIGHHLLGHTLEKPDDRDPKEKQRILHQQEIDADRYAGFILRRMRATVEQAEAAVGAWDEGSGSTSHPPKELRLKAIREGWNQADEDMKGEALAARVVQETRPSTPTPPPAAARPAPGPFRVSANNTSRRMGQDWWTWNVFIEATPEALDQISCVVYRLHRTFSPNVYRVCERGTGPAFSLKGQGWGTFRIQITVLTKDNRQYELFHDLSFR